MNDDISGPACIAEPIESKPTSTAQVRSTTDRGASLVEYALLLALIAIVCAGAVTFLGEQTGDSISTSTSKMFLAP